ncbi:hypothetical protein ACODT5_08225 [Streptomyces sp. 5.8]|uniref:hypothetical protein n=1 Tax=Streptomyces sp. 5.8 TaxID=3406571 RepID=UPI003BB5FC92
MQVAWVPRDARHRHAAYKILAANDANQAGELAVLTRNDAGAERREFGDAAVFVDTALAHLLGKSRQSVVAGAGQARAPLPAEGGAVAAPRSAADPSPARR